MTLPSGKICNDQDFLNYFAELGNVFKKPSAVSSELMDKLGVSFSDENEVDAPLLITKSKAIEETNAG